MEKSRLDVTFQNITYSVVGQIISIILSFILRIIFIKTLGDNLLGIDSVYTNVVSMLSLAELGVGAAINYSLYKPLSTDDIEQIKSLMNFYKKIYRVIGGIIFVLGLILTPFANSILGEKADEPINMLYFLLFVASTAVSYFYSYKRTIIIADQYRYITIVYRYIFFSLMTLIQIFVLLFTQNYVLFLWIKIICTFLENLLVSKKADKMYPYLKNTDSRPLDKKTKEEIKKNSYAMSLHKIGGVVVNSTDSILISQFVGLIQAGIYSNYAMIISALNIVINQVFTAVVASVGNLGALGAKKELNRVFNTTFLIGMWVSLYTSGMLIILLNTFIDIWLGQGMKFSKVTVYLIVFNFFLIQVRRPVLTFRDALGLYWYDRYKPLLEATLNLAISLYLGSTYGLNGIFVGTSISMIVTSLWIEPFFLYKKSLGSGLEKYLLKLLLWSILGFFFTYLSDLISSKITTFLEVPVIILIVKFIMGSIILNVLLLIMFIKDNSFKEVVSIAKRFLRRS